MKVNSKMAILFWLKGKPSIDGKKHLYARVTLEGKRVEIAMGKKVPVDLWNQDLEMLTDKSESCLRVNRHINDVRLSLEKKFDLLESLHPIVTAQMVKDEHLGIKREKRSIGQVADFFIEKFEKKVEKKLRAKASLSKWKTCRVKIKKFLKFEFKVEDIDLSRITYSYAEDFVDFMVIEQDLNTNSAFKYFKQFKQLLKYAVERGWLLHNPVQGFRSTYVHPERDILHDEELMHMYNKNFSIQRLEEVKDAYLFMCFTGYAFKDVEMLTPDHVTKYFDGEDWIIKNRHKTWCRENVPLLPYAKAIIEKYKNHPYCIANNRLLPVNSNQKFNAYLKEVADLCGIQKELTTHTARHTFATTVTLANGVPIETVSAMLGHKSIKTTQIYAKIVAAKISKDMKELKDKLAMKIPASMMEMTEAA